MGPLCKWGEEEEPIKYQNNNKDTEKLGQTGFSGFMVTTDPDEQDPIIKQE